MKAIVNNDKGTLVVSVFEYDDARIGNKTIYDAKVKEKDGFVIVKGWKKDFKNILDDDLVKQRFDIDMDDPLAKYLEVNDYLLDMYEIPESQIEEKIIYKQKTVVQWLFRRKRTIKEKVRIITIWSHDIFAVRGARIPYEIKSNQYILETIGETVYE